MRKLLASALLFTFASVAFASCPPMTKYRCVQMPNGKMSCGCY